jgi:primosomal replication protein N
LSMIISVRVKGSQRTEVRVRLEQASKIDVPSFAADTRTRQTCAALRIA